MLALIEKLEDKSTLWQFVAIIIALAILPLFLGDYYLYLMALIIIRALFASSLNLVLGYGGMLQLHPGVFFGLGAYSVALIITKTPLPFWVGFIVGPLTALIFAVVIGWICVRLKGLYFGMLTLALGQLVWSVVYRWYEFTGGDDGIHGLALPEWLRSTSGSYFVALAIGAVSFYILFRIVNSPFGLGLKASRDNPQRSESIGINIKKHRLIAFAISGLFAGVAGVLFVVVERSVSPNLLFWVISAETLIMCLVGGMHRFWGPAIGAFTVIMLRSYIGSQFDYWLMLLGIMLLLVVLFLPQGILGFGAEKYEAWSARRKAGVNYVEN